ncbi:MAG: HAD-IC family P-type ATPase, partial [Candidatus Parcubacteria bacterium]|nr:HAD-IC family P-type ATPase [Candidatus Parcubacteria bacterium]
MNFSPYTIKTAEDIFGDLKSSKKGLSQTEAEIRIKTFGKNEIKGKEVGLADIFWRQFRSPFFYLLFFASTIAFLIGERIDGIFIIFFVVINTALGFFQEARAQRAVAILKKYIASTALAIRDGAERTIEKNLLVPGDVVVLEAGNIVPADLRLVEAENILIDESILSGESSPVAKNTSNLAKEAKEIFGAANMAFAGTSVITGEALGIVIDTGKNTVLGEITKLVSGLSRESVYENDMIKFSRLILKIVVSTIIIIFLANLLIKGTENIFDFSLFCIALIVSIIPEALPVVITFALSEGALKLAKEKVIVKRLSAVEDLGDIEILCTDKTGTLTENKLELDNVFSVDKEKCCLYGLLMSPYASKGAKVSLTPFDSAIFNKSSAFIKQSLGEFEKISDMPFDYLRLFSSNLVKDKIGEKILIIKGAPEAVL